MCFQTTIPDSRALQQSCRTDLATRSSRPLRPLTHHQEKRVAEAPRSCRLNELATDLTETHLASSGPRIIGPSLSPRRENERYPEATQQARCAVSGRLRQAGRGGPYGRVGCLWLPSFRAPPNSHTKKKTFD